MSVDVFNVWDELFGKMCIPCEYCDYCHGVEDDANDVQMIMCIGMGQIIRTPDQKVQKKDIMEPIGIDDMEEN